MNLTPKLFINPENLDKVFRRKVDIKSYGFTAVMVRDQFLKFQITGWETIDNEIYYAYDGAYGSDWNKKGTGVVKVGDENLLKAFVLS